MADTKGIEFTSEQAQRIWDAIGAINQQMWELRKDMDRISEMRHDVSTVGIDEAQEAIAELGVLVLGDGEIPEEMEPEEGGGEEEPSEEPVEPTE